jgi:hypothetical protein
LSRYPTVTDLDRQLDLRLQALKIGLLFTRHAGAAVSSLA